MKRIYRALLKLYPARFREEYAAAMERDFRNEYGDAPGMAARAWLVLRALADLAMTLPAEIAREMKQDLRYAARVYRRRSVVTSLAVAALALAIGATTGIFSVLNAVLIRSLPFRDPEQLVELWRSPVNIAAGRKAFQAWHHSSAYLADAAGYATNEMNIGLGGDAVRAGVAETTANFLAMLGSEPEFGRGFAPDEDVPGRDNVAVIGYALWQQYLGGNPGVLGSAIRLNGVPVTVIGVAPPGFDYPNRTAVWTPTVYDLDRIPKGGAFAWQTVGRLKRNISVTQASAMFEAEVRRSEAGRHRPRMEGYVNNPHLLSLRDQLAGQVRPASLVLMGLVGFVLLIACANVAHLLLSRSSERRHEIAVRAALGASRARLVQQLITEAIVLTVAATIAGLAVAHWTARLAATAQPAQLASRQYNVLDWRVLAFALVLALLTGIVFGVLPASLIGRMQPGEDVVRRHAGLRSSGTGRMRSVLIALQAALTVALAAGAFSTGRTFLKLLGADLAFRTDRVVTLNVSLAGTRYETESRQRQYYAAGVEALRSVPGVESAAAVSYLPLIPAMFIAGRFKLDSGEQSKAAVMIAASPAYFRTMGTEVIEGREFTDNDRQGAERVVIVSDEFARGMGVKRLVGRKLDLAWRGAPRLATIVGVVRAERFSGPQHTGGAQLFMPIDQSPPGFVSFVAKVRGNSSGYLAVCRDAVQRLDRGVPVYDVKTLDQRLAETLAKPRFYTTAILFLSGFALLLALVGTYGVATYSVAERTHELGVRSALGALPAQLRGMVFRQSMLPVAAGLVAGLAGAAGLGRFLEHLIAGAESTGPWICAAAAALLAISTGFAIWTATGRIVRMDPTAALKSE
jgi:predicted permease